MGLCVLSGGASGSGDPNRDPKSTQTQTTNHHTLTAKHSAAWGGTRDDHNTGHVANGRRVMADSRDVTRHVVAGLATALAGVLPPYARPLRPGDAPPARGGVFAAPEADWRWAVGATPFGPYSNFSGVSDALQNAARRNLLIAHAAAALREGQRRLDAFDAFVATHFEGPWAAAGVGADRHDARRHFLGAVTR